MDRFQNPLRGQRPSARQFNAYSALARMLEHLQVVPPLRLLPGRGGRVLSVGPDYQNRPIFGLLSGAGSPYSWTEQLFRPATHDWVARTPGRSGTTNAYEINATAGLAGKIVPIYRGPGGGEYLFRWNRIVTPPPPPIECSNCIEHWPDPLTMAVGGVNVTFHRQVLPNGGVGYVGCSMVPGVSGWDMAANYGCGGTTTCDVPLFWFLNCINLPTRSKRVGISSFFYAVDPSSVPFATAGYGPCPPAPDFGTPACSIRCDGPGGRGLGAVAGVGDCTSAAPGCNPWGFSVGNSCGTFFGSATQCPQDFVGNGGTAIDLPDDFNCFGGIDLLFPALTTFSYSILTGSPHVTG